MCKCVFKREKGTVKFFGKRGGDIRGFGELETHGLNAVYEKL